MTRSRVALLAGGVLVASAVVAATPTGSPASIAKTIVKVRIADRAMTLDRPSAPHWYVTFAVVNRSTAAHELVILRTTAKPWKLAIESGRAVETGRVRRFGTLEPGQRRRLGLNLQPGTYVLLCNLAGHYRAGQRVGFTVT